MNGFVLVARENQESLPTLTANSHLREVALAYLHNVEMQSVNQSARYYAADTAESNFD